MKRLLWSVLFWTSLATAQVVGPGFVNYVTSAPSGACSQGSQMRVVLGSGSVYTCQSGTWAQVGGAGGSGTVTSVLGTANQINSDGSTTTPTLSLSSTLVTPGTFSLGGNVISNITVSKASARITINATSNTAAVVFTSDAGSPNGFSIYKHSGGTSTTGVLGIFDDALNNDVILINDSPGAGTVQFQNGPSPIFSNGLISNTFSTGAAGAGNCGANGTAASPSVVTCGTQAAGTFSCATNASAATCTVNTTAVTANSDIFVQEVSDANSRLSITCNTAPTVVPAILLASKIAATSFTINMPTIAANPACFNYWIVN